MRIRDAVPLATRRSSTRLRAHKAASRGGGGDEVDDDLVRDEGLAAPVLRDERETMFDLVPTCSSPAANETP